MALLPATIKNIINLAEKRLDDFKGESRRSYQKALQSFRYFVAGKCSPNDILSLDIIENWIIENRIQGLSEKTMSFYVDKLASLYGNISSKLEGGKTSIFKDLKLKLRSGDFSANYNQLIEESCKKISELTKKPESETYSLISLLKEACEDGSLERLDDKSRLDFICQALRCGVKPDALKSLFRGEPLPIDLLDLCPSRELTEDEKKNIFNTVKRSLLGNELQWFAMRLRPGIRYEDLLRRFSQINKTIKMPELFYPCQEIAMRVGRRIVWKGRPFIPDVVFFRYKISEIYLLFNQIYDLAWCYRNPGEGYGTYAVIPSKSMEVFRKAIGILGPGYEVAPAGELELNPGDEVMIVTGDYADKYATVLKAQPPSEKQEGIIYRVSLKDTSGHWDIGIDARLLKKV